MNIELLKRARDMNTLAMNCFHGGEVERAVEILEAALDLIPDSPLLLNNLANACQQSGDYDRAQDLYRQTIALRPDYPHPYRNLAANYLLADAFDAAMRAYQYYLHLTPDDGQACYNLGLLLMQYGEIEIGQVYLQRAIDLLDESDLAQANAVVSAYLLCGELDQAQALLNKILTNFPDDESALLNQALVYVAAGDIDGASACLNALLDFLPHSWLAVSGMAALHLCRGEVDQARALLQPLAQNDVPFAGVFINLAYIARDTGDREQARGYLQKALSLSREQDGFYRVAREILTELDQEQSHDTNR